MRIGKDQSYWAADGITWFVAAGVWERGSKGGAKGGECAKEKWNMESVVSVSHKSVAEDSVTVND